MHEKHVLCAGCGKTYRTDTRLVRCECGDSLEVVFDYRKMKKAVGKFKSRPFNHSRYLELYPVKKLVSVQEGATPLVRSKNIEKGFGLKFELYFKYEAQNPTGSFKDRGSSVEIAKALELRGKHVICASTGNMGASVAAYSAMANLKCSIFTPRDAPAVKMEQILAYGADVYHLAGDYTMAANLVEHIKRDHVYHLAGDYLWRREGTKSVGFEMAEQLKGINYVVCPVGNGTLISATWKAMKEFKTLGLIGYKPRMVGVQATGCAPLCNAMSGKSGKIRPVHGHTIATAIECGDPLDGPRALKALKESKGFCEKVNDMEILKTRELLATQEGLFAEPAGAVALAGILKARKRIKSGSRVVCLVTGHGLKVPRTGVGRKPHEITGRFEAVEKAFSKVL